MFLLHCSLHYSIFPFLGMASVLKESKMAPLQQEAVEMVVSSGDLLLSIINDVLDYSKLETEKVNVHVQRTNLQDTITLVLTSIKSKAHPTQSIRSSFDIDIPELVHTDSRRLQQILFNLLGNAIKFSPDNGTIKLCLKMLSTPLHNHDNQNIDVGMENSSSSWSSNNNDSCNSGGSDSMMTDQDDNKTNVSSNGKILRFIVEDNGKGIDKKDLKRIFQPFQQASSTAENIYGGTGLGLSITQKLVKALQGNVRVESKKGEWSKFIVDFPFTDVPVNVLYKSQQVSNYVLHIVGLDEFEQESVMHILSAYNIYTLFFNSVLDMVDAVRTTSVLPDQVHICLVHEDHFDDNSAESLSDSVILTYGPKFSVNHERAAFHFRSFHHILPSYFVNHLIRCVEEKKQQQNNMTRNTLDFSKVEVKAYTDMKILIAEDNVVNQKVLTRILQRLKVENIDIVENGLEACKKEAIESYDIVFMDQQMPIMGGVTACKEILSRPGGHVHPTIIFVTAHVSNDFERECMDAGGSGFIPKPFKLDVIEQSLQKNYKQRMDARNKRKRKTNELYSSSMYC
jgi:CheY-like chemotaxis protein